MKAKPNMLVTGASSGLGKHFAIKMARRGARLAVVARGEQGLQSILAKLSETDQKNVKVVVADLAQRDQVEGLVERCEQLLEAPIDILVNNAGASVSGRAEDIPLNEYDRIWRVNYLSPVSLVQQVLPKFKQRGEGMIVNVTSGVAKRALPFEAPYCSSKAALSSFTEGLRVELLGTGIHTMLFSPGPVMTGFHDARIHYGSTKLKWPPFDGKDVDAIAERFCQAIESRKERVQLGTRAKIVEQLNHWFPSLTDRIVGRAFRIEAN